MNKIDSINNTLRDIYVSLKNGHYEERDIYQYLTRKDVSLADRAVILSNIHDGDINEKTDLFYKWIKKFKKKKNIDVFCSYNWRYFCQFVNGYTDTDCYKIYVPSDSEHIYDSANRIFNFLRKNNIKHTSKIGKRIRIDDIVIRVNSEEDCKKVLDFVNKDKYIKEGAFSSNVFALSHGIANVAYDGDTSYNVVVSSLIADYINTMHDIRADAYAVNINTFINYIDSFIKNNKDYYSKLGESVNVDCEFSNEEFIKITDLLKANLRGQGISYYYDFMRKVKGIELNKEAKSNSFSEDMSFLSYRDRYNKDTDYIVEDIFLYFMKKYNKDGFEQIKKFISGNYDGLKENKHLYDLFMRSNINVYDYCSRVFVQNEKACEDIIRTMMINCIIDSLKERFAESELYTGVSAEEQSLYNISEYIKSGQSNWITNKVNSARLLLKAMDNKEMLEYFKRIGVKDIYEYNNNYYNNEISEGRKK